jgi:hypothetical protein
MPELIKTCYLRLPADVSREVRHQCIKSGGTVNALILEAIRRYLETAQTKPTGNEAPER